MNIVEDFMRPLGNNGLPVNVRPANAPLVATNRWMIDSRMMSKTYMFSSTPSRNHFIESLLEYEETVQHYASLVIDEENVMICLTTKGIDTPTEVDKEFARFADESYRDVV
jgi:pterin-4a-carbinolamine dehydratase